MIRIAVCDDERPVRESIVKALGKYKTETGTDIVNRYPSRGQ